MEWYEHPKYTPICVTCGNKRTTYEIELSVITPDGMCSDCRKRARKEIRYLKKRSNGTITEDVIEANPDLIACLVIKSNIRDRSKKLKHKIHHGTC